jgi:hypothetical protein
MGHSQFSLLVEIFSNTVFSLLFFVLINKYLLIQNKFFNMSNISDTVRLSYSISYCILNASLCSEDTFFLSEEPLLQEKINELVNTEKNLSLCNKELDMALSSSQLQKCSEILSNFK